MSTASGTATSYLDLMAKLRTFLTTDSTLVSLGQNWTELASSSSSYTVTDNGQTNTVDFESYLMGPGLSGTEQIYIQLQAYHNVAADIWNWRMRGAIGYTSSSNWFSQPGASPSVFIYLWNTSIPYWFIANGQRVIVVAKIGTVYESCYLGKFLPDGTPGQYPYPLFIGGCGADSTSLGGSIGEDPTAPNRRYSDVTNFHAAFFDPACSFHVDLSGAWNPWCHWSFGSDQRTNDTYNHIWPWADGNSGNVTGVTPSAGMNWIVQNIDGSAPLLPTRLEQITPVINILGMLDGVYATSGQSMSSETTITVGSDTYIAFQDTFRSGRANFCALKDA